MVAYSSMAQAVGTRRAWSRAILFKLKNRAMCQGLMKRKRSICLAAKKKDGNKKSVVRVDDEVPQANKLRQLVPGGKSMDICSLLEETAHYVKCLTTQVKVLSIHMGMLVSSVHPMEGLVISWSSAGTCGFNGTRRRTPFAAQTTIGNSIRTIADQECNGKSHDKRS
ncbi:30S ribosomal protein S11, chloroplastic [Quillaja saponaria]|uniref:30S ribosomal protein S11, chloroplastic n=1 Tax=Quillaja saponaria TaxID=32244 RepID=A0AAD7VKR1_QUISA|nr:30S ribosomal protein S11, chloroplastic [Quillaja saponaria]